jgi:hypothetical protein
MILMKCPSLSGICLRTRGTLFHGHLLLFMVMHPIPGPILWAVTRGVQVCMGQSHAMPLTGLEDSIGKYRSRLPADIITWPMNLSTSSMCLDSAITSGLNDGQLPGSIVFRIGMLMCLGARHVLLSSTIMSLWSVEGYHVPS